MKKREARARRAKSCRSRIGKGSLPRLSVHRTNLHIYASIIDINSTKILVSASTLEPDVKSGLASEKKHGGNISAASIIGKRLAAKAKKVGISAVAFDRSGFKYHGRIKALADSARESGLEF